MAEMKPVELSEESILCCPHCGFDYNHIQMVYTRMGCDEAEACIYQGTSLVEPAKQLSEGGYRRSAVVIEIEGECGHRWNLVIQQHKGNLFMGTERLRRYGKEEK
jgi:hypothetical protein